MSTLAEIEEALTKLSADELAHIEVTLRRLRESADADAASSPAPAERWQGFAALPEPVAGGPVAGDGI